MQIRAEANEIPPRQPVQGSHARHYSRLLLHAPSRLEAQTVHRQSRYRRRFQSHRPPIGRKQNPYQTCNHAIWLRVSHHPWGVDQIGAPEVWSKSLGQNIHVGVIDTGIDYNHPDLRSSISRGINLLNRSMLPYDDNGHGTHIAGTIAATGRHSGIIESRPDRLFIPLKHLTTLEALMYQTLLPELTGA